MIVKTSLLSSRVTPSHSLSDVQWINEKTRKKKTFHRHHPSKKIKYTVAAIATGLTIAILVSLAILLPNMNVSKTTINTLDSSFIPIQGSTVMLNISLPISTIANASMSITLTSLSTTVTITTPTTTTINSTISTTTTTTSTSTDTTITTTTITYGTLRWNKTATTVAGSLSSTAATSQYLYFPLSITIDSSNTMYVADSKNNRIQRFSLGNKTGTTAAGQSNGVSGTGASFLDYPNDIAIDSRGNIYVVDTDNHRIQLWYPNASSGITIAGNGTAGNSNTQLYSPRSIALDPNSDRFYVTDCYNNRIMSYTLNSTVGTVIAGGNGTSLSAAQVNESRGLYYDSKTNNLFIVNRNKHNIIRLNVNTFNWTIIAGSNTGISGNTSQFLRTPWDLTFDPIGNLYVADRYNQRIQFFAINETNGTTIAGTTGILGNSATTLNEPLSIALDNQLNLYVVDSQNNRIQKFERY